MYVGIEEEKELLVVIFFFYFGIGIKLIGYKLEGIIWKVKVGWILGNIRNLSGYIIWVVGVEGGGR